MGCNENLFIKLFKRYLKSDQIKVHSQSTGSGRPKWSNFIIYKIFSSFVLRPLAPNQKKDLDKTIELIGLSGDFFLDRLYATCLPRNVI